MFVVKLTDRQRREVEESASDYLSVAQAGAGMQGVTVEAQHKQACRGRRKAYSADFTGTFRMLPCRSADDRPWAP